MAENKCVCGRAWLEGTDSCVTASWIRPDQRAPHVRAEANSAGREGSVARRLDDVPIGAWIVSGDSMMQHIGPDKWRTTGWWQGQRGGVLSTDDIVAYHDNGAMNADAWTRLPEFEPDRIEKEADRG